MKKIVIIVCMMLAITIAGCSKDMDQLLLESPKEKKTEQVLTDKKEKPDPQHHYCISIMLGFEPE
ncbi:MAG: hypothetical protein ABI480_05605 [Chitinophagaceae bacterium]